MGEENQKLTPMFEQYMRIKEDYPDALLFYRMGDFYELFFEDAKIAAKELQIALTSRSRDTENAVPMCGVPWHASQAYIAQLVEKGFHIAICEQIEDPRQAKGLVKRAVTRIVTPATVLDDSNLDAGRHNYLGVVCTDAGSGAFVWADISTGQWSGIVFPKQQELWQWVVKMAPREILVSSNGPEIPQNIASAFHILPQPPTHFDLKQATSRVLQSQGIRELATLDLDDKPLLVRACGALLAYLEQTQKFPIERLLAFTMLDLGKRLLIDEVTEQNLEIFSTLYGKKGKGTLRHVLNRTLTPMGSRLLEDMLHHPWRDITHIRQIQTLVVFFKNNDALRLQVREKLKDIFDLERLITRISLNRCSPKDFISLRNSLALLPALYDILHRDVPMCPDSLKKLLATWDDLSDCTTLLQQALHNEPPALITEGGLFKEGFNAELDHLLNLVNNAEQQLNDLLELERKQTANSKLKLGFNRVFGYYYEISKNSSTAVPAHFIRRQSLANAERFTTESLKHLEEEIIAASEKRKQLEYALFQDLRQHIASLKARIYLMADLLAHIDYWQGLAEVARSNNWSCPDVTDSCELSIVGGRHPVVEDIIGISNFVPNDIHLKPDHSLCLLTGPNMAGKSTVLRQVAHICLLAQMGSMVPAEKATVGIVDRIFSRVGASDNLAQGSSTFMVEMMETARILRQSTKHSLIILDEIGRGTSTFDGLALAWAVVEYLIKRAGGMLRTLFATHYHELTALEDTIPSVFTMNIAIREYNNEILFLHKLVPGPSDRSYGVEVAKLAGIPMPVVQRARTILANLEQQSTKMPRLQIIPQTLPGLQTTKQSSEDAAWALLKELRNLDIGSIKGREAIQLLRKWQERYAG